MTTFHARETLGLLAPNPARLADRQSLATVQGLTGHWTGVGGSLFHPDNVTRLRGIQRYHMDTLGYGDIAYEGAFDADANTYGLRDARYVGAHASSNGNRANLFTDGIVFLEDARGWTLGAQLAWHWWIDLYHLAHGHLPALFSHRGWERWGGTVTACPGTAFDNVIRLGGGIT
jgi:hypothetical protein